MLAAKLEIAGWDLAIIVFYLVGIVTLGCWAGVRQRRGAEGKNYFLAGGTLRWPMIGLALFATNISTIHLVSQAEEGYKNGLAYGNFEWMATFTLIALSLFFAPFYIRSKVATLPDFLEKRYNKACRNWLAFLSIISAIFIHITFSLYTGAIVLEGLFNIPMWHSIIVLSVLTGLYTIIGGLMAVVVTESIQAIILLAGAICITIIGYEKIGGWEGLTNYVEPVKLTMLRTSDDPANLPWYSVFLGYPIIGLWYWCADQTIVQRVLGAKDENHARIGPLFAGFIKILPVFIFILPGTICLALINKGQIPELEKSADTYGHLIRSLLPTGLKGMVAAALLAALMSTVSGALNSIATLFSYDIYKQLRPGTSDHKLVIIGRVVTFFGMVVAILSSRYIERFESIYQGCVTVICYIAPPITTVFVLGVFWKRASSAGAMAALYIGSALGFIAFWVLEWCKLLSWINDKTGLHVNFMVVSFILWVVCSLIQIIVSRWKPEELTEEKAALVWKDWREPLRGPAWKGIGNYKLLAGILFAAMIGFYIFYSRLHPLLPESPTQAVSGLSYACYKGERDQLIPQNMLDTLKPDLTGVVEKFETPPVLNQESCILKFAGFIHVPKDGRYTFYVKSEQGCRLYVGKVKMSLWEQTGKADKNSVKQWFGFIDLVAGDHAILLVYNHNLKVSSLKTSTFPMPVKPTLEVSYKGPGRIDDDQPMAEVPPDVLFHETES